MGADAPRPARFPTPTASRSRRPVGGAASHTTGTHTMEEERLNQISDQIDDLRARTDALRGYL